MDRTDHLWQKLTDLVPYVLRDYLCYEPFTDQLAALRGAVTAGPTGRLGLLEGEAKRTAGAIAAHVWSAAVGFTPLVISHRTGAIAFDMRAVRAFERVRTDDLVTQILRDFLTAHVTMNVAVTACMRDLGLALPGASRVQDPDHALPLGDGWYGTPRLVPMYTQGLLQQFSELVAVVPVYVPGDFPERTARDYMGQHCVLVPFFPRLGGHHRMRHPGTASHAPVWRSSHPVDHA